MKVKIINIINIIIAASIVITDIVISSIRGFDQTSFYITCFMLMGLGGVNLIFILIKEAKFISVDTLKFQPILWLVYIVIGVAGYYMIKLLENYDRFSVIYWISFIVLIVAGTIVIGILDYKEVKRIKEEVKKRGPKIMVNNNRK